MPSSSKSQQQAAAIAEHHPEKAKGAAKEMAKSMSKKQLHDFASTPSKNLPEHVSKEGLDGFLDGYREKTAAISNLTQEQLDAIARPPVVGAALGAPIGAVANQMGSMTPEEEKAGRKNRIKRALMGALVGAGTGAVSNSLAAAVPKHLHF